MTFSGIVIHGKGQGRALGYPTANVALDGGASDSGVFSGYTRIGDRWLESAIFIHMNTLLLEVHILDFEGDLYGQKIVVELAKKIRDSRRFESAEALKEQIALDIVRIRKNCDTQLRKEH